MNKRLIFLLSFLMCAVVAVTAMAASVEDVQGNVILTAANQDDVTAVPVFTGLDFASGVVTVNSLNVRQGPSTEHDVIQVLSSGDTVRVLGQIGEWFAVYDLETGRLGSVNSNYININAQALAANEQDNNSKNEDNDDKDEPVLKKFKLSKEEQEMLDLVNAEREKEKLNPLEVSEVLMETSRLKAKDMAENNYFSHQSPTYGSPFDMMKEHELEFRTAGENIAGNKTVEGAFKAWMKKEGNKSNILNPDYKYIGIGINDSDKYGKIFVQQFIGE